MHNVLHVSNLHSNLHLVSKLISKGLNVYFNFLGCVVRTSNGEMLVVASLESNLYQLDTNVMSGAETNSLACSMKTCILWTFGTKGWGISMRIA